MKTSHTTMLFVGAFLAGWIINNVMTGASVIYPIGSSSSTGA
jgi:hypothetical protein